MSTTPNNMDEGTTPENPATPEDLPDDAALERAAMQDAARDAAREAPEPGAEPVTTSADPAPQPEAPKKRLALATELQGRIDELNGQLLRALAEVDNVRKRSERMVTDAHKYAVSNFAKDILSVPDNLRRAMDAVPEEARTGDGLVAKLLEGVLAVDRDLGLAFEKHGLERLEPMDIPFDPNFHEAVYEVPNSGKPAGTVVQLLQTGYTLHGRLIRAAMVGVSKGDGTPPEHKVDTTA